MHSYGNAVTMLQYRYCLHEFGFSNFEGNSKEKAITKYREKLRKSNIITK